MGAGTVLGLYNVSLQYQQHNANRGNCISSATEHKEGPKYAKIDEICSFLSFQEVRNQEIIGAGAQQDRESLVDNISRHLLAILAVLVRQSIKNGSNTLNL